MATNETTPVKKVPSYMRGTATSSNRVTPEKKKLPTQPLRTSYQPRMSVPKSPARKMAKGSDVISKPLYTPSPSLPPPSPPQTNGLPHKLELAGKENLSNQS